MMISKLFTYRSDSRRLMTVEFLNHLIVTGSSPSAIHSSSRSCPFFTETDACFSSNRAGTKQTKH